MEMTLDKGIGTIAIISFIWLVIIYLLGIPVPIMGLDSAQYAAITREVMERNDFIHLYNHHKDYLDKPPLIFWLAGLSFRLFGDGTFAFKLPALISSLIGIYSTFQLGKLLYGRKTGLIASMILASSLAIFQLNLNPITDVHLISTVIFSIWQLAEWMEKRRLGNMALAAIGTGLALLAKGPIGLMVPVLAFGTGILIKNHWKKIFDWHWLVFIAILGLILLPMSIGLYEQFDQHPEKTLYGQQGLSGLKFFFWDQSFGRLTGDNPFINDPGYVPQTTSPAFFLHTILWSFFPWGILIYFAIFRKIQRLIRRKIQVKQTEFITLTGVLLPLLALSLSEYKLPHYIYVTYPLMAIICAKELVTVFSPDSKKSIGKIFLDIYIFLLVVSLAASCFILFFVFTGIKTIFIIGIVFLVLTFVYLFFKVNKSRLSSFLIISLFSALLINYTMNGHFYPRLMKYQSGSEAAFVLNKMDIPSEEIFIHWEAQYEFEFYAKITPRSDQITEAFKDAQTDSIYVFTTAEGYTDLLNRKLGITLIGEFDGYKVNSLSLKFLNPKTRPETLKKRYLLLVAVQR